MTDDQVRYLTQRLTEEGKLVEAGWIAYRVMVIPSSAGNTQLTETRRAFFAGAQHLLAAISASLDPDDIPNDADVARVEKIYAELDAFMQSLLPPAEAKA